MATPFLSKLKSVAITQAKIKQFADIVGDHNPVHIDPIKAAETRFGGIISHGMLSVSYIQCLFHPHQMKSMEIKFMKPVRPGDVVQIKLELYKEGTFESMIINQEEETVTRVTGTWSETI